MMTTLKKAVNIKSYSIVIFWKNFSVPFSFRALQGLFILSGFALTTYCMRYLHPVAF